MTQPLRLGQTRVVDTEGKLATYRAGIKGVVVAGSGVVLVLQGGASVVGRITEIVVSGTLTTGAAVDAEIQRFTSGPTGGTANTPTVAKADTLDGAPGCTLATYSTPPTGGLAGAVDLAARKTFFGAPATTVNPPLAFNRTDLGKAPMVRGVADFLGLALTTGTWTGALVDLEIEWTEEPA